MRYLCLFLLLGVISCSKDREQVRGYNIQTDMAYTPAYKAFTENPNTPDGKTMIDPVEGTVARGKMPHLYDNSEDEAARAGRELTNPHRVSAETYKRGEFLYQSYCMACHGPEAKGDGPVARKGFPPPPSLYDRAMNFPVGRIYHIITVGYGVMPSHAQQISAKDRWILAEYIKKIQRDSK